MFTLLFYIMVAAAALLVIVSARFLLALVVYVLGALLSFGVLAAVLLVICMAVVRLCAG